jgi:DNA-binding transcriptional regulator PaaX
MISHAPPSGSAAAALSAAVKGLLRHFHRQSPIRGGSLLITIFGDSIAPRGGAVSLGGLIELARPLGLAERLVRTSVARLAREGWLVARRSGRRSEYRLTPIGRQRFAEATRRIYGVIPSSWHGQWTLLVLPPVIGGRPQDIRDELRWLGFGQVSPGVFAHPNWSVEEARTELRGLEGAAQGLLFKSSSEGGDADRRLVAMGWDVAALARRYRRFVDTFTPVANAVAASTPAEVGRTATAPANTLTGATRTAVAAGNTPAGAARAAAAAGNTPAESARAAAAAGNTPAESARAAAAAGNTPEAARAAAAAGNTSAGAGNTATAAANTHAGAAKTATTAANATAAAATPDDESAFVTRTLLIHEYRKIHLQDPLLPPALLPADWVGAAAYELTKRLYSTVFQPAERYLSNTASTMTDPLPAADASAYARFGGLATP